MVHVADALQRCTDWVHTYEVGILKRLYPRAWAWHHVTVSLVVTVEVERYSASIAVDHVNTRTGKNVGRIAHTSGWVGTQNDALVTLAREVITEALHFGVDLLSGLEKRDESLHITASPGRHIFPINLFGVRHHSPDN